MNADTQFQSLVCLPALNVPGTGIDKIIPGLDLLGCLRVSSGTELGLR